MTQTKCYTYYRISGKLDPNEISARLGLLPFRSWKIGDRRKDGSIYDFASWEYGRCDEYDVDVANQMRKTIAGLLDKVDVLNQIRNEYQVVLVLEIVPTICAEETTPCLSPSLDVIDFCHATRTEIDIDYYVIS